MQVNRDVAAVVMNTAGSLVDCVTGRAGKSCCDAYRQFTKVDWSWWLPCYWDTMLWDTGLRIAIYTTLNGTWLRTIAKNDTLSRFASSEPVRTSLEGCPPRVNCHERGWPVVYSESLHQPRRHHHTRCGPWQRSHNDRNGRLASTLAAAHAAKDTRKIKKPSHDRKERLASTLAALRAARDTRKIKPEKPD